MFKIKFPKLPPLKYPVILYGAGIVSELIMQKIGKNNIVYIVDKYKKGERNGVPIKDLNYLTKDYPIVIASIIWEKEIYHQLKKMGFSPYPYSYLNYLFPRIYDYRHYTELHNSVEKAQKIDWADKESFRVYEKILEFRSKYYFNVEMDSIMSKEEQYFIPELKLKKEIYIDCGAYSRVGSTILDFLKKAKGEVYAFELDKKNYKTLKSRVKGKNIHIYNLGVYKKTGFVSSWVDGDTESRIGDYENEVMYPVNKDQARKKTTKVVALDDFLKVKPTFIKMDIEGSETDALLGLKNTIRKYKPKLAICVYHKTTDLWELPMLVKKLNPDYKLYLRHHSREIIETVMYTI